MSGEAREKFSAYIKDGDMGKFASELTEKLKTDFTETMKLLRDKGFQELLINYPRAKRNFIIGYDVRDEVTSEVMFRLGSKYQKPGDYLVSIARFVRENQEKFKELEAFKVNAGDLLISCSRVTLGRTTQVPEKFKEGVINQALLKVTLDRRLIRSDYFIKYFRSIVFQSFVFEDSQDSAQPNIKGVKELKELPVPVPPPPRTTGNRPAGSGVVQEG